jgi:hypothetical protein
MPRLTKQEVDTYIQANYNHLRSSTTGICKKFRFQTSDMLNEWYLFLLKTEQTADKKLILSRSGLLWFIRGWYQDKEMQRKNRKRIEILSLEVAFPHGILIASEMPGPDEEIYERNKIKELYKKVSGLKRGAWNANRNKICVVPNKKLQQTFKEIVTEVRGKGTRQAFEQRRKTLIKRLREAYGIQ